jgi:oxygen-independent coproporphyrinogen-3 oxidase
MSGVYIHIPFCKKACHYCNFHFSTSMRHADDMVNAIRQEIRLRKQDAKLPVETIYFGGGTPSVLITQQLRVLLGEVYNQFEVIDNPEITLEANPDDLSSAYILAVQNLGVNRLSIGVQSFLDDELTLMNRAHNASQALSSVERAKKVFDNVSIDLLFGNPNTTLDDWKRNLDRALQLEVPHISSYALTLEPKTVLERFVDKGLVSTLDENVVEAQFHHLVDTLTQAGYDHYELSSFGKAGYHSQNNMGYWQGKTYLGIGPSAHGFDGNQRYWNVSNNASYMQQITKGELPQTIEKLSVVDRFNESIMVGLRASWGVSLQAMENDLGLRYRQHLEDQAKRFVDEGLLHIDNNALKTTPKGAFLADGISADLFLIDFLAASS